MREGPLAELFEATEKRKRLAKSRFGLRQAPPRASLAAPIPLNAIAIASVGTVAVAALVISVWPLADRGGVQPITVTVLAAGAPPAAAEVPEQPPEITTKSPGAKPKTTQAKLRLTAARGDCWFEVRVGSAKGKVLFSGTLKQGQALRFAKRRLWFAFGAGGNLDVSLNGQRVENFPTGTAAVVVTSNGISAPTTARS